MKNHYYLCKYGHVLRISSRQPSAADALRETFGTNHGGVAVPIHNWKYATLKEKQEWERQVTELYDKKFCTKHGGFPRKNGVCRRCEDEAAVAN